MDTDNIIAIENPKHVLAASEYAGQIYYKGILYPAEQFIKLLVGSARHQILLYDHAISLSVLELLDCHKDGIRPIVYVKYFPGPLSSVISDFNQSHRAIPVGLSKGVEDRLLVVDDVIFQFDTSLKDISGRLCVFMRIHEPFSSQIISKL